ncbi:5-carboxy-2-oxohept-3-enedioate decarboxylase HpaG1 subunit [Bacillus sp. OV322]|nr:fumarylacetoacetate hydrolase family protein [Bacillus sp. OV322]SFC71618.1 5-carboxy-2-oxohept-3-enedioate decarboxylase HpaG1 subunit [Bacillus sp. OV322]
MNFAEVKFSGMRQRQKVKADPESGTLFLNGKSLSIKQAALDVPISGTVYGTMFNYQEDLNSINTFAPPYGTPPRAPVLYIKPANTLIACNSPIPFPDGEDGLSMGAALGIVIGKTAYKISRETAYEYISGYTIVNDVSIPHQSFYRPAIKEKIQDGFCPAGPWVIDREYIEDPDSLLISVYLNGELKQQNHTSELVRPISQLLADVTNFMTLYQGDVLLAGVPAYPPIAKRGDIVKITIEKIGFIENMLQPDDSLHKEGSQ